MTHDNRIDLIRPDAPALAKHSEHAIGVRTIEVINKNQIDVVKAAAGQEPPRYDRKLTLEVWYPAETGGKQEGAYPGVYLRDGKTQVTLHGKAGRDAQPKKPAGSPYPLVIVSHGYPGNRFLLSHLAENLATKGYAVVAIDHADSTYNDQGKFGSTLINRPLDQVFVLNAVDQLSKENGHFLNGLIDTSRTGLIGYSMGGYGAVITAGAGVTKEAVAYDSGVPAGMLSVHLAGSESHKKLRDERIKAVVAIAPWGMQRGFWNQDGLPGITTPILYVAGSKDDVSGYEKGVRALYSGTVNADRYMLTFENANHNAAAPIPAPVESWQTPEGGNATPFNHYADPVWDTVRMNNITQHFVTAFLGRYVKADPELGSYMDVPVERASEGVFAANKDGSFKPEHTYWKGFPARTAVGLILERGTRNAN
ncbi:dienelactone hydrolase family protein [Microvirga sp. BT290]|uniref:Dienelactone hydrolase family protein n=2 Tax=Microvirga terrestris TaxID=2791024 RepID=A0ABS0HN95_9HYPH|nr:alpha/beta fold hydrolase [Microvirga terrestris]MBF9194946.1 dienelactone hydrolase family protein [Microvirga terrestris]